MKSENGLTLIEVAAGLVVLGIFATMVNSYLLLQQVSTIKQEKNQLLQDKIMENVAELHGRTLTSYPAAGNCLARYYGPAGVFLREETGALSAAACSSVYSPTGGEVKVILRFKTSPSAYVSFTPSKFLSLPNNATNLVEIEISGAYTPPNGRSAPPLSLTLLKRV